MLIAAKDKPMDARPENTGAEQEEWRESTQVAGFECRADRARPRSAPITAPATVRVGFSMYLSTARLPRNVRVLPAACLRYAKALVQNASVRTNLPIVVWPLGLCMSRFLIEGEVRSTPQQLVLSPGGLGSIRRCQCTRPWATLATISISSTRSLVRTYATQCHGRCLPR